MLAHYRSRPRQANRSHPAAMAVSNPNFADLPLELLQVRFTPVAMV
jgi:hypothetical protein